MYFLFMHNQGGGCTSIQTWAMCYEWCSGFQMDSCHHYYRQARCSLDHLRKKSNSAFNALHWLASTRCLSFDSSPSSGFTLSVCQRISFACLGSTKYCCRRGVIGKYHTTFCGAFFLAFLYREAFYFGQMVFSACSFRYMMQSLMHV